MGDPNLPPSGGDYSSVDCDHFPAGQTPRVISVTLSGIQKSDGYPDYPDPPNGQHNYSSPESPLYPCTWDRLPAGFYNGGFYDGPGAAIWFVFTDPFVFAFQGVGDPWQLQFDNLMQEGEGYPYYGGQASINLNTGGGNLNILYNLYPNPLAKLETFPVTGNRIMQRLVNNQDGTNIIAISPPQ